MGCAKPLLGSSRSVAVVTFKGVTAEARRYDQLGEWSSSDIDVLVEPSAVGRAGEIVAALEPGNAMIPHISILVANGSTEAVGVSLPAGVTVDVHFNLLELGLPLRQRSDIWARTVEHPHRDGGSVSVLDPETAIIHLLLHLNKDRFSRLRWYADIARLLQREPDLDWDFINRFLRTEGLEAPFYLALDAVCSDLGLEIPNHAIPTGWRAAAWRRLWDPGPVYWAAKRGPNTATAGNGSSRSCSKAASARPCGGGFAGCSHRIRCWAGAIRGRAGPMRGVSP
jgi:hypothetical protein